MGALKTCIDIILAGVLHAFLLPALLPFLLVLAFMHAKKYFFMYFKDKENLELMTGQDAFWMDKDDKIQEHFHGFIVLDGQPNMDKVLDTVSSRLLTAKNSKGEALTERLRKYSVKRGSFFYWKFEENFDVKEHVRYHPDQVLESDDDIRKLINTVGKLTMPDNKSKWYFDFYPISDGQVINRTLFLVRIQHSVVDGVIWSQTMSSCLSEDESKDMRQKLLGSHARRNKFYETMQYLKTIYFFPLFMVRDLGFFETKTPLCTFETKNEASYSFSAIMDLNLMKKIKNASKTAINDIFLACLSQCLRRMFKRKGLKCPPTVPTVSAVYFAGDQEDGHKLENILTTILFSLPVECTSSLMALNRIKHLAKEAKTDTRNLWSFYFLMSYGFNILPYNIARMIFLGIKNSLILSNLQVAATTTDYFGQRIIDIGFVIPFRGSAAGSATLATVGNQARAGCAFDKLLIDPTDADAVMDDFVAEIHLLAQDLGISVN